MALPTIFMFSGQGSHYFQMGQELYQSNVSFRQVMDHFDHLFQQQTGLTFLQTLYSPSAKKSDLFNQTLYTHPALFAVQYALAEMLKKEYQIYPAMVLGVSLGEFVAAAVGGYLDADSAFLAVVRQAQALERYCQNGLMMAIFSQPALYHQELAALFPVDLAAINFSNHFAISGLTSDIKKCEAFIAEKKITTFLIPVSQGFHSYSIDEAEKPFLDSIQNLQLFSGDVPLVSCSQSHILSKIELPHLWFCVRKPILFLDTIEQLEQSGSYYYLDIGPSGTLATFLKYALKNDSTSQTLPLMTPYQSDTITHIKSVAQKISLSG